MDQDHGRDSRHQLDKKGKGKEVNLLTTAGVHPSDALVEVRGDTWRRVPNTFLSAHLLATPHRLLESSTLVTLTDGGYVVKAEYVTRMYRYETHKDSASYRSHCDRGYEIWYTLSPEADHSQFVGLFQHAESGTATRTEWSKCAVEFGRLCNEMRDDILRLYELVRMTKLYTAKLSPLQKAKDEARNRMANGLARVDTAMFTHVTLDCWGQMAVFADPHELANFIVIARRGLCDFRLCVASLRKGACDVSVRFRDRQHVERLAAETSEITERWAMWLYPHDDDVSSGGEAVEPELQYELSEMSLERINEPVPGAGPASAALRDRLGRLRRSDHRPP